MTLEVRKGFTLVELLVTTSLMALVGGATVAALAGGVRVWERAAELGIHRQNALLAFEHIRRDTQNARRFAPVPFEGAYDQVAFAAVDDDPSGPTGAAELGRLGYFLDQRNHVLCRSFVPYRLMRRVRLTERCRAVGDEVTRVRFAFFGPEEAHGTARWVERWRSSDPPMAVRVELSVLGGDQRATAYSWVISLMSSAPVQEHAQAP